MPTQYPVLDNRPIDQWKVTELREELRRRRIATKGLKEELVRRLGEAIRSEEEAVNEGELNSGFEPESNSPGAGDNKERNDEFDGYQIEKTVEDAGMVDVTRAEEQDLIGGASLDGTGKESAVDGFTIENNQTNKSDVTSQLDFSSQDSRPHDEKRGESEPSSEDVKLNQANPNNQISEVSTDLGFQAKCESVSTDSVSINEKNKLKDNLNADNFHLELEVVEPEMVQPSSSHDHVVGDLHPLDDDKGPGKDQVSFGESDSKYSTNVELIKKEDSIDGGSPEKLNLDRSSGDESMDEDVLDVKLVESKNKSDELGGGTEISKLDAVEEGTSVDVVVGDSSSDKKDVIADEKLEHAGPIEKRKLEGHEIVGNNGSIKRQRRWNPETLKVPEQNLSNMGSSSAPKDAFQPTSKSFSRSDSALSADTPKERIVPPPNKPATNSLRIDRFLRPFTLKAVQELLAKTGTVCNFWMDHIKTHCFVTYSSVKEAIETRNAVYNLQWPANGGRLLVAEFVDPQEVNIRVEAPPESPAPITPSPTTPVAGPFKQPHAPQLTRQHSTRQELPPPPPLPLPPPLSDPPAVRERLLPPPPPMKKPEPPVLTLDDLFRKTRTTPRIYYLPLSDEQVAAKLTTQGKSVKE